MLIRTRYLTRGLWKPGQEDVPLFEVNPLNSDDPTDLVQRTGDLGRIGPRGDLEIHGRADDQVKIRGVRVHPAEVAALIRRLPWVADAAVVACPGDEGPVLAAYIVPSGPAGNGRNGDASAVRTHVASNGSSAMIPAHVVFLDTFPLTSHGKLDRSALPERESDAGSSGEEPEGEWTETEQRVAALWSEAYKRDITSRRANFFDLGGHSLMLARLLARVRRTFDVDLDLAAMFEHPTIEALAAAVDTATRSSGVPDEPETGGPDTDQPLSPEQEGLWFLSELHPGSSAYIMAGVFELPGEFSEEAVRATFDSLTHRHKALRLRFRDVDGRPVQSVGKPGIDFAVLPVVADRPAGLTALTAAASVAFDLASGPPVRVRTVRTRDGRMLVGLAIHHLCCDGVSWELISRQADDLLSGTSLPVGSEPDGLQLQFTDYALWRRRQTASDRAEADLAFWRDMLSEPRDVDLPRGRPVPGVRPHQALVHRVTVPVWVTRSLAELCTLTETTEYMAMMTLLAFCLSRASAQDQVVVGSDSAGRDREELEDVVGFFVRTHAYAFDMSGDPSFEEALARVRATIVAASRHGNASFPQIVQAVSAARGGDRKPLFSVMLRMPPRGETPHTAAALRPVDVVAGADDRAGSAPTAKFDLTVVVRPSEQETVLDLEYDADTIQAEIIEELGNRLIALLRFGVKEPARPLSARCRDAHPFALALVPREHAPVAELFRQQATRSPDKTAISWAHGNVTYVELAEAVAGAAGIMEHGARVGVVGGKSPATMAVLIAALGTGTVPLLLDEALPVARRTAMITAAGAGQILVTGSSPDAGTPEAVAAHVSFQGLRASATEARDPEPLRPGDPAYIFFTSGTTGTAKGVVGSHCGLDHFIDWEASEFGVHSGDRVAQLTTLSFDAMLRDVLVPLTQGATLCLPPPAVLDDTARLVDWLADERVTIVHTTPSVAASWLKETDTATPRLPDLRLLCLAGECFDGRLARELRDGLLTPGAEIVNFYGPTETTMIKTFYRVSPDTGNGPLPIGRALPGAQVAVIGSHGYLCGPGERGEIVIRTPYRTLGYLDDVGADTQFQRNPLSADPNDLLYFTGDLAVTGASGEICVEGRRDDLVKVRGVRIHPAEVAGELAVHPEVRQAYVEADKSADGSLVAYIVRTPGSSLSTEDIRRYARERLPLPQGPSLFILVDRFILQPNGKLDRASLTATSHQPPAAREAARDATESMVWSLWADLLGHEDFGITDDFFAVGGHSLLATILLTRIRKKTGLALSLRQLLEGPRVDRLAQAIRGLADTISAPVRDVLLTLREGIPGGSVLFVVHPIGGDVLCFRELASALPPELTVVGVRAPGLDGGAVFTSVQEMAAFYLHEVRTMRPDGPYHFAGWSMGGVVAYEMARQLSFEGVPTAALVLLDSYAPGTTAFAHFADPGADRAESFARDLERMTGEHVDAALLRGVGGGDHSLARRFRVFDANATALVSYRLRRARLRDTRVILVLANGQQRPEGVTRSLGWEEMLGTAVDVRTVPGADHFTLIQGLGAEHAAQEIALALPSGAGRD